VSVNTKVTPSFFSTVRVQMTLPKRDLQAIGEIAKTLAIPRRYVIWNAIGSYLYKVGKRG